MLSGASVRWGVRDGGGWGHTSGEAVDTHLALLLHPLMVKWEEDGGGGGFR